MKLVSVNVSLSVEIDYNNTRISTSIFKKPVAGEVAVSEFKLAGDQQVDLENHGGGHKAVYAFAAEQYDYWRQTLDRPELHYGQFGENLTISGLDEASVCIGDQIQIGDCILEATQPRIPCFKLGIALALQTMPKQFIDHGHTGIYFKVLKMGSIIAGDNVTRLHQHSHQLAVKTLFKAYFDPDFMEAEKVMQTAAETRELSDEWREKVFKRLAKT
tara:strand:+ start:64315 stop:64962 length:648 start_codon:yes stop_codon:yes gene_type:complete